MTADNVRPTIYRISIAASGLNSSAPSDGFIDPTTVERYRSVNVQTGSSAPAMNNGDTIKVNGTAITFVTGGLNLAGVIAAINMFTGSHNVVASANTTNLRLNNEALSEGYGITVQEVTAGALSRLGYATPTIATVPAANVSSVANSLAKERANARWERVIADLNNTVSTIQVADVDKTGGTVDAAPTVIAFSVTLPSHGVYTYDEFNANALIEGIPAVKRMISRALMWQATQLRDYYDPTAQPSGAAAGFQSLRVVVGPLANDLTTADAAVTVTIIDNVA